MGDFAGREVPIQISKVLLQIIEILSLGEVFGKFIEEPNPMISILPVGEL